MLTDKRKGATLVTYPSIGKRWASISLKGVAMEKIDLPFFYELGSLLDPITKFGTTDESKRIDIWITSFGAKPKISSLLDTFATLTVCRAAGEQLIKAMDNIENWMRITPSEDWRKPDISADSKFRLVVKKAKEFATVLSAELQTLATYHVTQKGIYSTTGLIERAENIFAASVLEKIRPKVIEEIRQSGRCLAFDCATASAFHIMRATESMMHDFYIAVCKPKPKPKQRLANWGKYITAFEDSKIPEALQVAAVIKQIKELHRNSPYPRRSFLSIWNCPGCYSGDGKKTTKV